LAVFGAEKLSASASAPRARQAQRQAAQVCAFWGPALRR